MLLFYNGNLALKFYNVDCYFLLRAKSESEWMNLFPIIKLLQQSSSLLKELMRDFIWTLTYAVTADEKFWCELFRLTHSIRLRLQAQQH